MENPTAAAAYGSLHKGSVRCTLDRNMALRFLGYSNQTVEGALIDRFESLARRCEQSNAARFVWTLDGLEATADGLCLTQSGLKLPGRDCAKHLEGAKHVALAALTLGHACEQELRQLKAVNSLDYLMYDACASALTEAAANAVHEEISQVARNMGLYAHARFSPGYGDLPLLVQPAFLDAISARGLLGLDTTPQHFLVPIKSITAIIGFFDDQEAEDGESPCAICRAIDYCCFRERGVTCHGKHL